MTPPPSDTAALRRSFYWLLTTTAVAICVAKIVGAENVFEPSRFSPPRPESYSKYPPDPPRLWPNVRPDPSPMFSSNDKSRWATIRALVDQRTFVIGHRENFEDRAGPWQDRGIIFEDGWQSLDKVMNPQTGDFYSSKPPLLPCALAVKYWLLKELLGWDIVRDRWSVMGTILILVNVLPFLAFLVLLARLLEDHGRTDFGRLFTFTVACFGTFLVTFSATLNNHTPATCWILFAVYPLLQKQGPPALESPRKLFASGLFAGFAAVLDLPALALTGALFVPLLWLRPGKTLLWFLPGVLLPIGTLFYCNYAAMGRILPAYSEFGGPWYNYPGSHWAKLGTPAAKGIDFADEPKTVYAFHMLFGHHGWFSLTPVWLLGLGGLVGLAWTARGMIRPLIRRTLPPDGLWTLPFFGAVTLVVSGVVMGFYIWRTNNYGGFTSGPRWLFWLIPLWLLGTLPAADWIGRRAIGRFLAAVLLGFSVLSVFYPAWNPWRPPWILQLIEVNDWVRY